MEKYNKVSCPESEVISRTLRKLDKYSCSPPVQDAKEKGFGKRQDQRNKKQRGMRGMNARGRMMRGRGFQ